jgi:hypothetical protein
MERAYWKRGGNEVTQRHNVRSHTRTTFTFVFCLSGKLKSTCIRPLATVKRKGGRRKEKGSVLQEVAVRLVPPAARGQDIAEAYFRDKGVELWVCGMVALVWTFRADLHEA